MKKKVLKLFSFLLIIFTLWSFAYAVTFTTQVGNYKNGQYFSKQIVSKGNYQVTKSAKWLNEEQTEAQVDIEVQSKITPTFESTDIVIALDGSYSAYTNMGYQYYENNPNLTNKSKQTVKKNIRQLLEGIRDSVYKENYENKVAIIIFAETTRLYYLDGGTVKCIKRAANKDLGNSTSLFSPPLKFVKANLKNEAAILEYRNKALSDKYDEILNDFKNRYKDVGSKAFTSSYDDFSTIINYIMDVDYNKVFEVNEFTNIDLPLISSKALLDKRPDTSRSSSLVIISDGAPDPIFGSSSSWVSPDYTSVKGVEYIDSDNFRTYRDGALSHKASIETKGGFIRSKKSPMNTFYKKAGYELRNAKTRILLLRTGVQGIGGTIEPIWNNITQGTPTYPKDKADVYANAPFLPVPGAYRGSSLENNPNIFDITRKKYGKGDVERIKNVITDVFYGSSASPVLTFTLKDVINYEDFDFIDGTLSSNVEGSTLSYNASTKTITWKVIDKNGVTLGEPLEDGTWPKITFNLRLKDGYYKGWINTNYIKNKYQTNDEDKATDLNPDASDPFTVPSPWLERTFDMPRGKLRVNYIIHDLDDDSYKLDRSYNSSVALPYDKFIEAIDVLTYLQEEYSCVGNNVLNDDYTFSELQDNASLLQPTSGNTGVNIHLSPDDLVKTINFYFEKNENVEPTGKIIKLYFLDGEEKIPSGGHRLFIDNIPLNKVTTVTKEEQNNSIISDLNSDKYNYDGFYHNNYSNESDELLRSFNEVVSSGMDIVKQDSVNITTTETNLQQIVRFCYSTIVEKNVVISTGHYDVSGDTEISYDNTLDNKAWELFKEQYNGNPTLYISYLKSLPTNADDYKMYEYRYLNILVNGDEVDTIEIKQDGIGRYYVDMESLSDYIDSLTEDANIEIKFYYEKLASPRDVTVMYLLKNDPTKHLESDLKDSIESGSSATYEAKTIKDYIYLNMYDVNTMDGVNTISTSKVQVSAVPEYADEPVVIKFYYKAEPSFKPQTIPPDSQYDPDPDEGDPFEEPGGTPGTEPGGDPSDPSSSISEGRKILVLDEEFTTRFEVSNYSSVENDDEFIIEFPFDVYNGQKFIKANRKITYKKSQLSGLNKNIGKLELFDNDEAWFSLYYRLPSWVIEKVYSNANCLKKTLKSSSKSYADIERKEDILVVGKIYDFTVTNLDSNDTTWKQYMFGANKAGLEYKADTIPIGQTKVNVASNLNTALYNVDRGIESKLDASRDLNFSTSTDRYGMLLGSTFLFSVNTKGAKSDRINITPKVRYYDNTGKDVTSQVEFYVLGDSNQDIPFADKEGSIVYNKDEFKTSLASWFRLNDEVNTETQKAIELMKLAQEIIAPITDSNILNHTWLKNLYLDFKPGTQAISEFGTNMKLEIPNTLRLPYANYAKFDGSKYISKAEIYKIGLQSDGSRKLSYVDENTQYFNGGNNPVGLTENQIVNSLGHWYGEYKLPSKLIVKKDGKVIRDGYIVVLFNISSSYLKSDGKTYGNYLNYASSQLDQWKVENGNKATLNVNFPATLTNPSGVENNVLYKSDCFYPVAIYDLATSRVDISQID